jgi:hypothetical protein
MPCQPCSSRCPAGGCMVACVVLVLFQPLQCHWDRELSLLVFSGQGSKVSGRLFRTVFDWHRHTNSDSSTAPTRLSCAYHNVGKYIFRHSAGAWCRGGHRGRSYTGSTASLYKANCLHKYRPLSQQSTSTSIPASTSTSHCQPMDGTRPHVPSCTASTPALTIKLPSDCHHCIHSG